MKQAILTVLAVLIFAILVALGGASALYGQDAGTETAESDDPMIANHRIELLLVEVRGLRADVNELGNLIQHGQPEPDEVPTININTASYDELLTVPGIGPVKAGSIVAERGQNGVFLDWVDLMRRVSGVGPATIADIQAGGASLE